MSNPSSTSASGTTTPTSRFTKTTETLEDVLKTQTVGLVHLSEFKNAASSSSSRRNARRMNGGELGLRVNKYSALGSRNGTPQPSGSEAGVGEKSSKKSGQPPRKKRKAGVSKGKLSFAQDEDEEEEAGQAGGREAEDGGAITDASTSKPASKPTSSNPAIPAESASLQPPTTASRSVSTTPEPPHTTTTTTTTTKPKTNPNLPHPPPKLLTKSSLRREAHERELLRREFLSLQERIKNEEILIPFVFYDGTNVTPREPGVRVKKGDPVWLFLERARRMSGRREWLRVSVDDLLLVRGEVIIPHHYEFYYFLVNRTEGPNGLLFDYPSPLEANMMTNTNTTNASTTSVNGTGADKDKSTLIIGTEDGSMTKVVDRRWYERNKHIFPASVWTNFDPAKDYKGMVRRDRDNNAFFFG
ncbi:XAP5, circadian clock regulator-domain-containing protein [Tirmania nivea]|nr:XAP5, circadian clock regulator-domain-containing protein [Tirmania nivea]